MLPELTEEIVANAAAELDMDKIRREVFDLFEIGYGLHTELALRKVQILEVEKDSLFVVYADYLKEAHDRMLSEIFSGQVFGKMEQNPLHSKDLNWGVPGLFSDLLEELLEHTES